MAKFRRNLKFGRKHSHLGSLDGVQFTHPLAEITQRTRWGLGKVQVTLKPSRRSRTNHFKSSLPTLGSFRYPQNPKTVKSQIQGRIYSVYLSIIVFVCLCLFCLWLYLSVCAFVYHCLCLSLSFWGIQVINWQNCNQCLKSHNSLGLSLSFSKL